MKRMFLLASIIAIVSCSKEGAVPQVEQPVVLKNEISSLKMCKRVNVI